VSGGIATRKVRPDRDAMAGGLNWRISFIRMAVAAAATCRLDLGGGL